MAVSVLQGDSWSTECYFWSYDQKTLGSLFTMIAVLGIRLRDEICCFSLVLI
jgi:hypothetical protein